MHEQRSNDFVYNWCCKLFRLENNILLFVSLLSNHPNDETIVYGQLLWNVQIQFVIASVDDFFQKETTKDYKLRELLFLDENSCLKYYVSETKETATLIIERCYFTSNVYNV